ncbi:peptidoglycan-binding domain-containing protein [Streptomyces pathocidini]|uniref:peptidoglycan-binding domain-containing protein n=1 Tax=Streptomyces pathocidini TaxID=1650571 RepID=UPI0033CBD625
MPEFPKVPVGRQTIASIQPGSHRSKSWKSPRRWTVAAALAVLAGVGIQTAASGFWSGAAGRAQLASTKPDQLTAAHVDTTPAADGQDASAPRGSAAGDGKKAAAVDSSSRGSASAASNASTGTAASAGGSAAPHATPQPSAGSTKPKPSASQPQQPEQTQPESGGNGPTVPSTPAQPPSETPVAPPPVEVPPHTPLSKGDYHPAVLELQERLRSLDLLVIEPTGEFCEETEKAVRKFQEQEGVKGDAAGVYGMDTHVALVSKAPAIPEKSPRTEG